MEKLLLYVIDNTGNTFSALSISKYLKSQGVSVTSPTVMNYILHAMNAFLFYKVRREDLKGKQILSTQEKYYVFDHGVREAVIGKNVECINLILENIVLIELLRRGYEVTVGSNNGKEIDFVARRRKSRNLYIQVTYKLEDKKTIECEFSAFDNLDITDSDCYLLSMDEFKINRVGVKHVNLIDFLLDS